MTPERIAELTALCEKATPGPWIWADDQMWFYADYQKRGDLEQNSDGSWKFVSIIETEDGHYGPKENDRDFIAAARTALPELLAELSRLTRDRDEAFNAGIEAAAEKVNGLIVRSNSWQRDAVAAIRALKKPATGQATGEK